MRPWVRRNALLRFGFILGLGGPLACSPLESEDQTSSPLVTDVAHTVSKRQSIGNCWLYAAATWFESLALSQQNQSLDVSESYWTWWHFYEQLIVPNRMEAIETGGSWSMARSIILKRGFVLESDFIAEEGGMEMSQRQKQAVDFINTSLQMGVLQNPKARTPELVRQQLDQAFASSMAETEKRAQPAAQTLIRFNPEGQPITLRDLLDHRSSQVWIEVYFPRIYGKTITASSSMQKARRQLWTRVFRALNDKQPVVMNLMIDFNALDNFDGTFKGNLLREKGPGIQGGHLTVLEDYMVHDVPGIGTIGRGDVSEEMQELALLGTLDRVAVKNSWGVNRPERGIKDGITLFDRSYLEGQFAWKDDDEKPDSLVSWHTTLSGFVLPPGY